MFRRTKVCTGLMLAFGGTLALTTPFAFGQAQLERVEITGSSIKRIEGETALPVQVITREAIEKTGASTVEQLLQTITSATSSGAQPAASVSSATTGGISSVSLRGLNSLHTLVLLNGRRIAPYGIGFTNDNVSVDVNSIPLAAVERVEILKDGASAVYGSDAIAGVINFILRRDFTGGEVTGYYGDTSGGGASVTRGTGTWGFGDLSKDRFNIMGVISMQKEKALFGRDRPFAAKGFNDTTDTTSGNTFPANITAVGGAFGTRNPSTPACPPPYSVFDPQLAPKGCRFDPSPLVQLVPQAERLSLMLNGKFAVTQDLEAYFEASYNRNKQNNIIQPVPISDQFALPPNHPLFGVAPYNGTSTIILSPSSPFYPTAYVQSQLAAGAALPDLKVRWRDNINGNRNITDIASAPRLVVGAKGAAIGWDFDASFLHSESRVSERVNSGYPILSQILPILNSGNVNFFGPNSAAVDAEIQATGFAGEAFSIKSTLDSLSGKATRELITLPAGPLAVAFGAEGRKEKYQFAASPEIQVGDVSGYGGNFLPVDKSRNVEAVFGEVNIPIFKGFEANAAVRWDHYQGVGSSTTPKLGLRYQPVKEVLLRASAGKGFRAPSLLDQFAPNTTGVSVPGLNDPLRCATTKSSNDCATQFPVLNGGNPDLKPEKSRNYTAGIVFEPTNNVSLAFDWFSISLRDQINNGIPASIILGDLTKYGSLVTRGPADPAFPNLPGPITEISQTNLNVGKTNLSGVDWDARVRIPAGDFGRFTISYTGTYFNRYDSQNLDGSFSPNINLVNTNTGGLIPRVKTYLSINLATGPWNFTLAQNWQNSYTDLPGTLEDPSDPAFVPRRVGAYETYDGQVQFVGVKNLKMTVGMKNLFNRAPPFTNAGGQTSFQSGYDPSYADPRGRFTYVSLTYAFK